MTSPTSSRSCGTCTLCCKVMVIPELAKPTGVWCGHCKPGRGCGVHGAHPASCQAFSCMWLVESRLPEALRPDRAKVVLAAEGDNQLVAICDPAYPMAWAQEPMRSFLRAQAQVFTLAGATVVAKAGKRHWLITPDQDVDMGELDPGESLRLEAGPDGRLRRALA